MTRAELRIQLRDAAVLTVSEAAERLPWGEAVARAWLADRGLVRHRPDFPGPVVLWREVLEELARPAEAAKKPASSALPRTKL